MIIFTRIAITPQGGRPPPSLMHQKEKNQTKLVRTYVFYQSAACTAVRDSTYETWSLKLLALLLCTKHN